MALQMWIWSALLGLSAALVCPDGGMCEDKNTCCKNTAGGYGCCPLPHAECCSDHLHCCYEGTLCDLVHEKCVNKTVSLPWMTRLPTKEAFLLPQLRERVKAVVCPDEESECPDDTTCCQLPDSSWACCPLAKAVCCEDKHHCCPEGTKCDLVHSKCVSALLQSFPMLDKFPARKRKNDAGVFLGPHFHFPLMKKIPALPNNTPSGGSMMCPDGKSSCPDRTTCCLGHNRGYYCCPAPDAVCCSDNVHCCPGNTTCDMEREVCKPDNIHLPLLKKFPAAVNDAPSGGSVMCPDGKSSCPDSTTCCPAQRGGYYCCPAPDAVCCSDNVHCCPSNTTCDMEHEVCKPDNIHLPLLKKFPAAVNDAPSGGSMMCPDGKSSCPDRTTCCLGHNRGYYCCPAPDAVCCSDNVHCCPGNTTCDMEREVCKPNNIHLPLLKKFPAAVNDVECPDKKSACPDETTCCQMANSSYGCCPMPSAVCCSDHIHCCPQGSVCDLQQSACVSARGVHTVAQKITNAATELLTAQSQVGAVSCNDSVACADGNTCCKSPRGEWACCPLPKAVCCEDHLHCCPHGTVCNLEASTCDDPAGGAVTPLLAKVPVFRLPTDNNKCDKSTSCPRKTTCCRTATGAWSCCPLPQAVCCDDLLHCCPQGTVCNMTTQTCDHPSGFLSSVPWMEKSPALTSDVQDEKCDKETMCPGGTTCCKKDSGQWACCPLPQAMCCSDHEHCCPKGYRCNVAEQTCDRPGGLSEPWRRKIPALQKESVSGPARPVRNMCDAQTSCPRDTTCCFIHSTRKWGCCPLPEAVCCEDGNHCCPSGHTCEPHRSSCSRGLHVIPWVAKVGALTEPAAVTDVKCDDKSSCASGTTCCKLPTGEWGCCPLVKAVCCADHEHCCPQGYTCNMETGTCEKKQREALVHAVPQTKVVQPEPRDDGDVPCDAAGEFRCSKQETCCRKSATQWTCCPSPMATCCSDSKHCCPEGYSCDLQAGGCSLQTQLTWDSLLRHRKTDFVPRGL